MNSIKPNQLPCFTTEQEQEPIARGVYENALLELWARPVDTSIPIDPQLLENEKLWDAGDKEAWLEAELLRIRGKTNY